MCALGLLVASVALVALAGCNTSNTMSAQDIKRLESKPAAGGPPPEAWKMIQKINQEAQQKMMSQTQQQAATKRP